MMATPNRVLPRPVAAQQGMQSRALPTPPGRPNGGRGSSSFRAPRDWPPAGENAAPASGASFARPLPVPRGGSSNNNPAAHNGPVAYGKPAGPPSTPTAQPPRPSPGPAAASSGASSPFGVSLKKTVVVNAPTRTTEPPSPGPLSRSLPSTIPSRASLGAPASPLPAGRPPLRSPQTPTSVRSGPGQSDASEPGSRSFPVPQRPAGYSSTPAAPATSTSSPSPSTPNTASDGGGSGGKSNSRRMLSSSSYTPAASNQSENSDLKRFNSFYNSQSQAITKPTTPSAGNGGLPPPGSGSGGPRSSLSSSASAIPAFHSRSGGSGIRKTDASATGGDEGKKDRLRQEAVKELINTEQDYINDLELVNDVFLKPLASRNLLDKQELGSLFSNLEMLVGVNQEIMKGLKDDATGDRVGQTFLSVMHYFKMYTVYCANQPVSLNTMEKCKAKNQSFNAFLDECMADPRCRGLTLPSYLIKPIQRLCKYPLILKTIYQNTDDKHVDYENLGEALKQMEKIVEYVNEGKRQAENSQKIMELQSSIDGGETLGLVQPTRRLLLENTFEVRVPKSKTKERHCVLFNDLFLCMKTKKKGTGYYDPLLLSLQVAKFIEISDTEEVHNSFEVQAEGERGETKSAILIFPSPSMKMEWAKEIKGIIRSYQKQRLLAAKKESTEKVASGGSLSQEMPSVGSPLPVRPSPKVGRAESSRFN